MAVILAAGVGSRLRPLTDDRPKALVPVHGRTILARAVDALVEAGIERVVLATGYREHALREALERAPFEVLFRPNPEYSQTQNSVSLLLCRDAVEGETFFRLDGDVVFDPEILSRIGADDAFISAAVDRRRLLDAEAMKVRLDPSGRRVLAFGKGIPLEHSGGESIGVERIDARATKPLFDALERARSAGETNLYYEDIYSRLIEDGASVSAIDVSDVRWCEIDSPPDLAAAERLFTAD